MAYPGPKLPDFNTDQRKGLWVRLSDVVIGEVFGDLQWAILLVCSVVTCVGLVWLFSLLFR